jgi:hypothetical protein
MKKTASLLFISAILSLTLYSQKIQSKLYNSQGKLFADSTLGIKTGSFLNGQLLKIASQMES